MSEMYCKRCGSNEILDDDYEIDVIDKEGWVEYLCQECNNNWTVEFTINIKSNVVELFDKD